jgi:carotenoid cleavage dioxygenase-like enzyme
MPVGDKIWALWENGSPMAMDAETLESEGFVTLKPDLKGMPFSAHPRIEADGRIWEPRHQRQESDGLEGFGGWRS